MKSKNVQSCARRGARYGRCGTHCDEFPKCVEKNCHIYFGGRVFNFYASIFLRDFYTIFIITVVCGTKMLMHTKYVVAGIKY